MDLSDSQDEFEVFNRPLSPESTSVDLVHHQEVGIITLDEMGIQRKSKRSLLDLSPSLKRMHLGNQLSPNFLLLLLNFLSLLLSHLYRPELNLLTRKGRESRRARRYWRLGDLALCLKKRPSGLPSSKRLDKRGKEAQRGEKIKHLSLRLSFQLQCSMVSP